MPGLPGLEAYKNVVETCEKVIEVAPGDVQSLAQAYNFKHCVAAQAAVKESEKKLADAEAVFPKVSPSALNCQYFVTTLVSRCLELGPRRRGIVRG